MIDRLVAARGRRKDKMVDTMYRPQNAITEQILINSKQERLAVLFPPWQGGGIVYRILTKRLAKKGWAVLAYQFHNQIVEPEETIVTESLEYIKSRVAKDIRKLVNQYGYKEVQLIGISLGTVPLTMVADSYPNFTSATLVVGGDDLAANLWHGERTLNYKKAFEREHIGARKLEIDWEDTAPKNHVRHFGGKKIKIIASLADKFVSPRSQSKLAREIVQAGGIVELKNTRVGHVMSIVRFCLFGQPVS